MSLTYTAHIRLAVIAHVEQPIATNKEQIIYHRKYRKQTKKWTITAVRCQKKYSYMKDLVAEILRLRKESDQITRNK